MIIVTNLPQESFFKLKKKWFREMNLILTIFMIIVDFEDFFFYEVNHSIQVQKCKVQRSKFTKNILMGKFTATQAMDMQFQNAV